MSSIAPEDDGCPNQTEATTDTDPVASTDVTGDGTEDPVHIVTDDDGSEGCRAFLVVHVDGGAASEPIWLTGRQGGLEEPRINSFVQIDERQGLEILVDEMSGASTQFVGAFTFVDGRLERIEPPEKAGDIWSGSADGLFPYGGSVGHIEGADCAEEGGIVVSAALPAGPAANTYVVARRFFEVEGAELTLRDTERTVATAEEVFDDFPEFRASPFGSCSSN
ncbi:MAG TPA: hypothetical protein VG408_06965 [Actinomycetota bacterium]|nr:hypothetical protein [Actinomycetota bacterium]